MLNDIFIPGSFFSETKTQPFQVQDRTTSTAANPIYAGEPVGRNTSTRQYVAMLGNGEPTTSSEFIGIATGWDMSTESSETTSADGYVNVVVDPTVVYAAKANVTTAADTWAEILALAGKRVVLDYTNGVWTVNTAVADSSSNGVVLNGQGDPTGNVVYFQVSRGASFLK